MIASGSTRAAIFAALLAGAACNVELEQAKRALESADAVERAEALERLAEAREPASAPLVVPLLKDSSPRVRKRALAALGAIGIGLHLRQVIERLNDPDLEVRLTAVRVLGDSGERGARPALLLALADPSQVVRRSASAALEALGLSRREQVRERAREALKEEISRLRRPDDQLRATAARMIGSSGRAEGVASLLPLLEDRSPLVVREAARALGRLGGPRAIAALLRLARSKQALERSAAVGGLAELDDARAGATLLDLVGDGEPGVRQAALEALARGPARGGSLERICPLLTGEPQLAGRAAAVVARGRPGACTLEIELVARRALADARGGFEATEILAALETVEATAALLRLAERGYQLYRDGAIKWVAPDRWKELDPGSSAPGPTSRPTSQPVSVGDARRQALERLLARFPERALGEAEDPLIPPEVPTGHVTRMVRALAGRPQARRWLTAVATEAPREIRVAALEALAGGSAPIDASVRQAVELALGSRDVTVRRAALRGCRLLGEKAAAVALAALGDRDFEVRSQAATCLGELREARATRPLLALLARERSLAAISALCRIGDHAATRPLLAILQEDHPGGRQRERELIIESLGLLGDRAAVPTIERELTHPSWRVRRAAAAALARVRGPSTPEALRLCEEDYYTDVRRACALARRALRDGRSEGERGR